MGKITPEILQKKGIMLKRELQIKELKEKHGNAAASSAEIFITGGYFGRFPIDVACIGTICEPKLWSNAKIPGNLPHPKTNPVWNFDMPKNYQPMKYNYGDWLFTLIKIESKYGWPAGNNEYSVIYSPIDELYTLDSKELFVPGKKVGIVEYPTSHGYDLWMLLNPNQEGLDEIKTYYE